MTSANLGKEDDTDRGRAGINARMLAKCVRLFLDEGNVDIEILAELVGVSRTTARRLLNALHAEQVIYISAWQESVKGPDVPLFSIQPSGCMPKPDKPRPRNTSNRVLKKRSRVAAKMRGLSNPFNLRGATDDGYPA